MKHKAATAIVVVLIPILFSGLRIWSRYDRIVSRFDLPVRYNILTQLISPDTDDTSGPVEDPKPTPTNKAEVLDSISYYGDPATCRMTAEQARGFADLLDSRHFYVGPEKQPEFRLLLGDFAGDGIPYLYINRIHYDKIEFSQWSSVITDGTEIFGWKDNTAQVIYEQAETAPTLEKQHKLTGSIILADRQRPNETDWCGKYYNFADGDIHLQYHWEKYFNWDDELWYFTENGTTRTYTSDEYYALPADMRNDPISRDIVLAGDGAPTDLNGRSLTVMELCEALNLYADFVEAEASSPAP